MTGDVGYVCGLMERPYVHLHYIGSPLIHIFSMWQIVDALHRSILTVGCWWTFLSSAFRCGSEEFEYSPQGPGTYMERRGSSKMQVLARAKKLWSTTRDQYVWLPSALLLYPTFCHREPVCLAIHMHTMASRWPRITLNSSLIGAQYALQCIFAFSIHPVIVEWTTIVPTSWVI